MTLGQAFDSLLTAALAGADWAWAELYDDLSPLVLGYLRGRGAADPEDLTGEVFLQVVRDIGSFDGGEREFRAWVLSMAHHRLLDDIRYRKRRPADVVPDDLLQGMAPKGDVEADAMSSITAERVVRIIRTLSADQQDVLLLRMVADLSIAEVARIIDKPQGAVKALQHRALVQLRRKIARESVSL
jgi:RNA polymerase sigma factor (sigma-70 family)